MAELLTSLDVVNQSFKKSMRGYDPAEVDEFLDGIAETLQVYAHKNKEMERELAARAENLAEYDKTRSILHEALLIAQRSADEKVRSAEMEAERIVAEAMERADVICGDASREAERLREGVAQMRNVRVLYEQEFRGILAKFDNMMNQVMSGSAVKSAVEAILDEGGTREEQAEEADTEEYDLELDTEPPPDMGREPNEGFETPGDDLPEIGRDPNEDFEAPGDDLPEMSQDLKDAFEELGVDPRILADDPQLRRAD